MQQQAEWKGLKPQRFQIGRRHIRPEGELNSNMEPGLSTIGVCGIRTFAHQPTSQQVYKTHQKVFPHAYERTQNQIDLRGKKYVQLGQQTERVRPEKSHVPGGQETNAEFQNRGIRSFECSNALTQTEYGVESKMQRKTRIGSYEEQRNGLGIASLGDKAYKYPQYSSNFYHSGGLIPGSTFRPQPQKQIQQQKNKKLPVFTKPNWNVRVQMDEIAEEKRAVNSVDQWEQTILKQANPNWNDPDTFFQRMEAAKKDTKQQKKAGKK